VAVSDGPLQQNFLQPSGFALEFRRLPYTTFFCQEVSLPGLVLPTISTGNPFVRLNYSATSVEVGNMEVTFKVDEDLRNYTELVNWIKGLGFPESFDQYADNKATYKREALRSDASLIITTSGKVPNISFDLIDLEPVSVSPLRMRTTDQTDISWVEATASFSCRDFVLLDVRDCVPAAS
jgi:hypothetical protein